MNKTVLITGCSTGFGKLAAKKFQQEGWHVVATMRSPQKETELTQLDNVLVTKLDVSDQQSVNTAVKQAVDTYGTIDVLVNNAGFGGNALLEQFSEDQIYAMYETNVFGLMRTSRAVLPIMRKKGAGTIINVTSMAGVFGLPLASVYGSTKYAVEGLSEAMAIEYKPLGITIRTILPGAYGTNFVSNTDNPLDQGDAQLQSYAHKLSTHRAALGERIRSGQAQDPQEVADLIYQCATTDMPVHNIVGADAERLWEMISTMTQQELIDQMAGMFIPKDAAAAL